MAARSSEEEEEEERRRDDDDGRTDDDDEDEDEASEVTESSVDARRRSPAAPLLSTGGVQASMSTGVRMRGVAMGLGAAPPPLSCPTKRLLKAGVGRGSVIVIV